MAILQARTSSGRLPGKVLRPILGLPMILHQIARVRRARSLDRLIVATSTDPSDDHLAAVLAGAQVAVHRGALDDVLGRFAGALAALAPGAGTVVRLTADCPLADPDVIDATVAHHRAAGAAYTSNCLHPSFPDGLDVEVVGAEALRLADREAVLPSEREHVTPFIRARPERFAAAEWRSPRDLSHLRWTVDTPGDLAFVTAVYERLHPADPDFGSEAVLALLDREPGLAALNTGEVRNAGYAASLAAEAGARA
ncbi:cytidylyltransferase domain-containing protein [Methylobacterium crusticola]|uniref:cytidylyltransferase domain-containing protein n=1 Tax=Methylobacterium crusticola TaxID=1697972 RepID=UPI001939ED2D|nr:glycosyltransferase family protein [Methylobacterium crusticola]